MGHGRSVRSESAVRCGGVRAMSPRRLPPSAAGRKTVEHPVVAETIALSGAAGRDDDAPGNDAAAPDHHSERRPRTIPQQQCRRELIVSAATPGSAAVIDGTATVPSRERWRREAAREGSDWLTILA